MVTDGLIAFLNARLDEDEAAAKAWLPQVRLDGSGSWYDEIGESNLGPYSIEHARLHDPARVLREAEAKRMLIADYEGTTAITGGDDEYASGLRTGLRVLAAAWSDHPDYRLEWGAGWSCLPCARIPPGSGDPQAGGPRLPEGNLPAASRAPEAYDRLYGSSRPWLPCHPYRPPAMEGRP